MHEVALNLFATDGHTYFDVRASAFLVGPGLALTARHNVELFQRNFERAAREGEARGDMQLLAVQTWLEPAATVIHRVSRWFAAPWTDLAILRVHPALDQVQPLPNNYRWKVVPLDLAPPPLGATIATFGFDDVVLNREEERVTIRARGATATGLVVEHLAAVPGNPMRGWPTFQTNARFDGGMSGGPVIHGGRACGVVSTSVHAHADDEEHASFVPFLWPAMAIEIDDPRSDLPNPPTTTLLQLAREGAIHASNHEHVRLIHDERGAIVAVQYEAPLP